MKLRILIADDHEVVRRGLCALLQAREGWEICAEAKDGREAVEKAAQLKPDVVILDVGMPNLNGLAATRQLTQHDPHCKVIVLTITDSDQVIREALDAGARGFVLKSDAARDLVSAVEALQRNRMFFTPRSKRHGARRLSRQRAQRLQRRAAATTEVNRARARSNPTSGGGKKLERSGLPAQPEHQDRRDAPQQHHAETRFPLHPRSGGLRGEEQYYPSPGARPFSKPH